MMKLKRLHPLNAVNAGVTLIESIAATLIFGILVAALAPPLAVSVATRIQARRVELASEAARTYIDGVRSQRFPIPSFSATALDAIPAPTASGTLTCIANAVCTAPTPPANSSLFCIDGDRGNGDGQCTVDSPRDMIIHAFANFGGAEADEVTTDSGFLVGARVYAADTFQLTGALETGDDQDNSQSAFARDAGFSAASRLPLIKTTTEIVTDDTSYDDLCARLQGCE